MEGKFVEKESFTMNKGASRKMQCLDLLQTAAKAHGYPVEVFSFSNRLVGVIGPAKGGFQSVKFWSDDDTNKKYEKFHREKINEEDLKPRQ